jgi:molybdopterin molybdotransferase
VIHPDEAVAMMASFIRKPKLEAVALSAALGRIMPAPVAGTMDQPPFDKAAMDGWAWNPLPGESLPERPLAVRGTIAAGSASMGGDRPDDPLTHGEAARIMTGAPLPAGASRIQRFEWSRIDSDEAPSSALEATVSFTKAEGYDNVIRRGENARAGDELLSPRMLSAQDIAILAADGRATAMVAKRPVVGVLSTGAELSDPGESLSAAGIYDSNRPQILAQLRSPAFDARDLGRLPDDFGATLSAIRSALLSCDVLILSGGVSMGDFDYVPRALAAAGVAERFHGVAMKPGKPTYFGTTERAFVFGLPGNPVSVFVNTELLVKELLFALSGAAYRPLVVASPAAASIGRKQSDRVEFLPVRLDSDGVRAVRYGGSSGIQALAQADGFARLEIGQDTIPEGAMTHVRLVR